MSSDSTYWSRSAPPARPADAGVAAAFDAASLLISVVILVHLVFGWWVQKQVWNTMRRFGMAITLVTTFQFALSLACNASGCSYTALVVIYNVIGGGLVFPIVIWSDMYLIYERYRALSRAHADLTNSTVVISHALQAFSALLAFASGGASWIFVTVLPFFVNVSTGSYYAAYRTMVDRVEVRARC
jgi:hypothetical protein